jgi:hypothetical protein
MVEIKVQETVGDADELNVELVIPKDTFPDIHAEDNDTVTADVGTTPVPGLVFMYITPSGFSNVLDVQETKGDDDETHFKLVTPKTLLGSEAAPFTVLLAFLVPDVEDNLLVVALHQAAP